MLVYANSFEFEPEGGAEAIIRLIARWLKQKTNVRIDVDKLTHGIRELKFRDGSFIESKSTPVDDPDKLHPYLFNARYTHGDNRVSGRRWITEIGIRQMQDKGRIECSILLRTEEMSTKITAPIMVTRPKLVVDLIEYCRPVMGTPGLYTKKLTLESAEACLREIERPGRRQSFVVISASADGFYPENPERLRSLLLGLADIVVIPAEENTVAIEQVLGRRYTPFGGAIKVIFPKRGRSSDPHFDSRLFVLPEDPQEGDEPRELDLEILSEITHRSNISESWRHISHEVVEQAILRNRLYAALDKSRGGDKPLDILEYQDLLEEADKEIIAKEETIEGLRQDLEDKSSEVYRVMAQMENIRRVPALRNDNQPAQTVTSLEFVRNAIGALQDATLSLEQALGLVAHLYPDRLIVLESAMESARESDKGHFQHSIKAHELLKRLVCDYWPIMANGGVTQQAKAVFSASNYSATENWLSPEGKRLRTFIYKGMPMRMDMHLRYGVKDSKVTTLRIHFEWVAEDQKLVIGHCGKHLDF